MRAREIEREYIALVRGRPPSRRGTIDAPIGRDRNDIGRMAVGGRGERPAVTHFELSEPLPNASLLRLKIETGRTHQIRVHLAAIGHPILGDPLYGVPGGQIGLRRQFLHAARLGFAHPADGHRVELTSELPPELAEALERARAGS
jgi:23S rRNA pseudouridine1911/1915/1917 synthase